MAAFHVCSGDWEHYVEMDWISKSDLDHFLNYSATFLSNIGNFYGSGDSKFIPAVHRADLEVFAGHSEQLRSSLIPVVDAMYAVPPYSLGFPGSQTSSAYYPGAEQISQEEIAMVSQESQKHSIYPENTRIRKVRSDDDITFELLQASVETGLVAELRIAATDYRIKILRGDHSQALRKVCESWEEAIPHATSDPQREYIKQYIQSFRTGDLNIYRESLKKWMRHLSPTVEDIFGFVEPYRDPYGIRAEFEGLVAIKDVQATELVTRLAERSDAFIQRLPWCGRTPDDNNGKGPFEKSLFDPPDFTCIHTLAYCSSILFAGINLPNYNDLRQELGFKNVIISNRMAAESSDSLPCPFVEEDELAQYQRHRYAAYYTWVVLHELLGHGTSQLLAETAPGIYNFDIYNPPASPLTNQPVTSWYKHGETWTSCFEDLSTTVDECRAELVGAYLMDDKELLALFGYTDDTNITADDVTYNLYMQQGTDGLRALADYNIDSGRWGQAHARAHFAVMKYLLRHGNGCLQVICDEAHDRLTVRIDRSKMRTDGKKALGEMLLRLHIYRCTADVAACRGFYEELTRVDGQYTQWHSIVARTSQPKWVFSQPNTFLQDGEVVLKEYPATPEGVIQSWAEREVH
ncbi:peptidase family M49-domain-containing protein [Elsinoe ampelina]|uniref:Peptidase family M49-domain-containing protein n=1 Tax=Elsinoe ampelina TaxID=302913 RepID=A0A6A6GS65_9PEZI|nr:peptidase family M49-domain-containing protein [Elsinoe ampelina]